MNLTPIERIQRIALLAALIVIALDMLWWRPG